MLQEKFKNYTCGKYSKKKIPHEDNYILRIEKKKKTYLTFTRLIKRTKIYCIFEDNRIKKSHLINKDNIW